MNETLPEGDAKERISALIATLHATGQRLEELTIGEVDTVADHEGQTFVLRHAQEHLRSIEAAKQAAILNALPAYIALVDTHGVIVSVNDAWRRFSGRNVIHAPGLAIDINYLEACDGARGDDSDDARHIAEGIRSVLGGGIDSFSIEYPSHSPTADSWFMLTATPLTGERPNGAVIMHTDVSERRHSEEALRTSEAEFRSLSEAMPQIVWVTRPDGWNIYFNQQWMDYTGLTLEESMGHGWNKPFHPDDQQGAWDAWQQATATIGVYSIESRLRRADGVYRWWLVRGVPIRDAAGNLLKWFGTCTDIHNLKSAELELAAHAQELARSNEELERFAHIASHDLQEPLRTVQSFTQLLIQDQTGKGDAKIDQYAAYISEAVLRMKAIIDGVLEYSLISHHQTAVESIDLKSAYLKALANLDAMIKESSAVVTCEPLPQLLVDANLFRTLFQNLIGNALKFHGAAVPRIDIGCRRNGGEWVFSVQDNGIGIPAEYGERVFGMFQRLHTHERYPGTGLGLAMCRRIVERHGGRIWVEPVAHGSRFVFTLPVVPSDPISLPKLDSLPPYVSHRTDGSVLLAENTKGVTVA